jgi:hypothetical protein
MRARVPAPTFDFEIKPRRSQPSDKIDDKLADVDDSGAEDVPHAKEGKKNKRHTDPEKAKKKQKKQVLQSTKSYKSKETVTESDIEGSDPEDQPRRES